MTIPHPRYVQTLGYGRTAMYMPFDDMPSTAAAFKIWVQNLETRLGTDIEVISIGLPNSMGDPTADLAKTATINQAVIWAMPITPNGTSGGGSLATAAAGGYNSLIAATATAFAALPGGGAANGIKGEHWVRPAWEFDTTQGYTWCVLNSGNSNALLAQAFDQVTTTLKANGYLGKIMLNGNFDCRTVYSLLAHPENVDALALDAYNNTNGAHTTNWDTIWTAERKPRLDAILAVCQANGLRFMFPEMGCEVKTGDSFHSAVPNTNYWKDMLGYMKANPECDVMAPFNLSMPSGAVLKTSEIAIAYCSPAGTVATGTGSGQLGSQHNTSITAPWTFSTSPNKTAEIAEFRTYFVAGSFQAAVTPPPTFHHRLENFPSSTVTFDSDWNTATAPPSVPWFVVPGSPSSLAVTRTPDGRQATITWTAPSFIGSSALTGYKASRDGTDASGNGAYTSPLQPTTTLSWTFLNLDPAQTYTFSVLAESAAGDSIPATIISSIAPPPDGPVTDARVTVLSPTAIQVDWTTIPHATSYLVKVSLGSLAVTSGDLFDDTFSDTWLSTAVPTGVTHAPSSSLVDTFSDTFRDIFGTPLVVAPPILPPTVTVTVTTNTAIVAGLLGNSDYIVTVKALSQFGSASASLAVPFRTLDPDASDPIVIPPPPVFQRPQPTGQAFASGASYRPLNFGLEVANNDD